MTLNSFAFAGFFIPVVLLHRLLPPRLRNAFLLLVSWIFYAICAPQFLPLLLATIALNYGLALAMERWPHRNRQFLCAGLLVNFGVLFLFKYLGFFRDLAAQLLQSLGLSLPELPPLLLPVGISFYTFAICGYLMDVYRQNYKAERNFLDFALFASFFPAVLSGPINRGKTLLPQLAQHRRPGSGPTGRDGKLGLTRFLWGLFLKVALADQLAVLVNTAYAAPEQFSGMQLLAAAVAYSLQIYCDFCGYSHMAIGVGRILGFELTENFNAPYLARSVKEFWRRWHMSLSTWFRDYLYFPLGGSRRGKTRTWLNVLIVFAVSGLWHGAAMTFVVWGILNGVYQIIGGILEPARRKVHQTLRLEEDGLPLRVIQTLVCFFLLTVTWVFFRAADLHQAVTILYRIVTFSGACFPLFLTDLGMEEAQLTVLGISLLVLFAADVLGQRWDLPGRLCQCVWLRYAVWVILLLATAVFGAYGTGYNAQEFLYFQF